MLEALKSRVISWILSSTVSRWVRVDKEKLKVSGSGITATELRLCETCLDGVGLPITATSGNVKKISVEWIKKSVVRIIVEEVEIHVRPRTEKKDWENNGWARALHLPAARRSVAPLPITVYCFVSKGGVLNIRPRDTATNSVDRRTLAGAGFGLPELDLQSPSWCYYAGHLSVRAWVCAVKVGA
eukprot:gene26822-biopygen27768